MKRNIKKEDTDPNQYVRYILRNCRVMMKKHMKKKFMKIKRRIPTKMKLFNPSMKCSKEVTNKLSPLVIHPKPMTEQM